MGWGWADLDRVVEHLEGFCDEGFVFGVEGDEGLVRGDAVA